jgi:predicted phosphodiesterase
VSTLITADMHLTSNPRDAYRHATMRRLVKRAKKRGVTRTLILGDLTEEKDRHNDWLVNAIVDHVKAFAELGDVYIDQGNHDYSSDPDCPFFRFLRHMPRVRWIGEPATFKLSGLGRVLFLPHTRDFKKAWDGLAFEEYAYIFAHGTFIGAQLGNGRQSPTGIPIETFPSGARIIAGDVHIPHTCGPVEYVGAPYTVDFGDAYNPRAIVIEGDRQSDIRLDDLPQKRLIDLDGSADELDAIDDIRKGDILKIRIAIPRRAAATWPEQRDRLRAHYEKRGCIVHSVLPAIMEGTARRVMIDRQETKTDKQVFHAFGRHRDVDRATMKKGERLL